MNLHVHHVSISQTELDRLQIAVSGIQERLAKLIPAPQTPRLPNDSLVVQAKHLYRARRRRAELFGTDADLFREPAWDILLDLFIAHGEQGALSVSAACIGAVVPETTALRHLARLEQKGLIRRVADPFDQRRSYVQLTPMALETMRKYLNDQTDG